jgi:hypothetical protein
LSIRKYSRVQTNGKEDCGKREMKTMGSRFSKLEEDKYTVHKSKDNCAVYTNRTEDRGRQIEQTTIVQCAIGAEGKDRQMTQKTIVRSTQKEQKTGTENRQEDNCTAHTSRTEDLVLKDGGEDDLLYTEAGVLNTAELG